eukprot:scaffold668598_cov28-Prasinocladus_malaysianus.AAC.1
MNPQMAPGEGSDDVGGDGSSSARRPTGRVVGVLKRNWRQRGYAGSLDPQSATGGRQSVLFVPVEKKFPRVRIRTRQVGPAVNPSVQ